MKKTWTLIALAAALCVSCSDDDKSCTEGAAFCKSGDNNTTVLVTCENGELNETVCNTGYICDSKKKMCTVAAECSNDMKPSCDQANNRIVYCSNNVITYTDCANGCSVETNKCNPATAGKGVCTAGAKRCNLAGEREICSAAGVWESKPCCDKDKGDSVCLLTCHSGECSSTIKEGMTRCASSSTYQVFESGAWSAEKNCSADKPVCDESKGACVTPSVIYCGEKDVELSNGQKMKLQAACDQMNGAGKTIGVCIDNVPNCSKVCQKADVGKTVPVCDIYNTKAGGQAPFAGQAVCTDLYDGTHYGLIEDDSTFKDCKNACNAEGTACDSQGFAEGGSSGGGSTGSLSYTYCGDKEVSVGEDKTKMKLQAACDQQFGANKTVGVCVGNSVTCINVCQKADVGTVSVCDIYPTTSGTEAPFAGQAVCTDLSDGTHYGLVEDDSTFKKCKNACNTEGTACDSQGFAEGGSSGGSTDKPWYCGKEQYSEQQTIDQYCSAKEGSDFLGYCTIEDGKTYFECGQSCTIDKVGNKNGLCVKEGSNYFSFDSVCTVVDADHTAYLADYSNVKKCTDGCNPENTACK